MRTGSQTGRTGRMGWLLLAGCAAFWVGSAGCESGGNREVPSTSAVQDPVLKDIPKPAGFKLVDRTSMAKASGSYRIAQCEYVGNKDRESVRRFYEEYMPSAGFELKHWSLDKGTYGLTFESTREMCDVNISPNGFQTSVVVKIGPRADSSLNGQPPAQPVGDNRPPPRRRSTEKPGG
ncbi:MAG: hypothetical protein HZB38_18645 [Planctomycetes bacterium]|nr:hypothetical protein [Planctomycetota bacterium]